MNKREYESNLTFLLEGSYVTKGGAISEYGSVRILCMEVSECGDHDAGLELWSPTLYKHRIGDFKAAVYGKQIFVIDDVEKTVAKISAIELSCVMLSYEAEVYENGWLLDPSFGEVANYLEEIIAAEKGVKPACLDNSTFIKVSTKHIGAKTFVIELDSIAGDDHKVFIKNGELIESEYCRPLSYKKWDPGSPFAQY